MLSFYAPIDRSQIAVIFISGSRISRNPNRVPDVMNYFVDAAIKLSIFGYHVHDDMLDTLVVASVRFLKSIVH
jgi:hypothetical protein